LLRTVIICLLFLLAAGAAWPQDFERYEACAERLRKAINAADFEAIEREFNAQMGAAMPLDKVKEFFSGLTAQFGKLRELDKPHWERQDFAAFPATFERGVLEMKINLDGEGRIGGLWFLPHKEYGGAAHAVPVDQLKGVLDRDLEPALKNGALAPATGAGVVIGVTQGGTRRIFVYGPVKDDSIFEIGSVSKTFTGLMLAQMMAQHKVRLDEPVRELLPPGTVAKPAWPEMTLLDLVTQQSGLPRLPDNLHPADPRDPYADYRPADLYQFLGKHAVSKPADAGFNYSNLGLGLLGQALANRAALNYPELLQAQVSGPLQLNDTVVELSPEQEKRFVEGHNAQHQPARAWNFDALAGCGAIRSTAADMLKYLEAHLHPDRVPSETLRAALEMSHELRADAMPGMKIAFAWLFETKTGSYWHNGATGGYSSYALFNPNEDFVVVVLFNTTIGTSGSFADRLGEHVAERLSGKPAISLE